MKLSSYDIADYLDNDEMVAAYLDLAFESGDISRIAAALGAVCARTGHDEGRKGDGAFPRAALPDAQRGGKA